MLSLEKGRDGMTRGEWGMVFHYWKSIFREIQPLPEDQRGGLILPPEADEQAEASELGSPEFDPLFEAADDDEFAGLLQHRPR